MAHFDKLKLAKEILGRSPGFLKTESSVLDVEEELSHLDMAEKRSKHGHSPEEDWGVNDQITKQGDEFDREVSVQQHRSGTSTRTTRASSKKLKTTNVRDQLTFNLTFSLKNIPSHWIEEVRACILMGLGPIQSSGIDLNTYFDLPTSSDVNVQDMEDDSSPEPPREKKRKTNNSPRNDNKRILLEKMRQGVQVKSRFDKCRFKTIKIGNGGLTEGDVTNILEEGNFFTDNEFLKLCIKRLENSKVILPTSPLGIDISRKNAAN